MGEKRSLWRTFRRNKTAVIGLAIAFLVSNIAIFAPLISPADPLEQDLASRLIPPGDNHFLGTDLYGRDTFSRLVYGSRISLLVGITSVLFGMLLGLIVGITAGLKGGVIENLLMRGVDILLSFPTLLMGLMVMVVLGQGLSNLIFAIGIALVPRFARVVHSSTLSAVRRDFILAAKALGIGDLRLIVKHIFPTTFGEILVVGTLWMATSIRIEASLSFLGLGVSPPTPTWGNMIRVGVEHLDSPWLALFPGLAILITVLSFNMVGDGLRDISDPTLQ